MRVLPWVVVLSGCAKIKELQENIRGLTESTVMHATVLGVAEPEDDSIDLAQLGLDVGANVEISVLDADSSAAVDAMVPIASAEVQISGDGIGTRDVPFDGAFFSIDGLAYTPGQVWTARTTMDDGEGSVALVLPAPPNVSVAEAVDPGEGIVLDVSGQGYHGMILFVTDVQSGEVTFEAAPADADAVVDLLSTDTFVEQVEIPGVAFPTPSVYAVGVAGLTHHEAEAVSGVNTQLSGGFAGIMRIFTVSTLPVP